MGRPTVSLVLVVVLGLTATLPVPTIGQAQRGSSQSPTGEDTTEEGQDNQCSPLQGRQDLLDSRLTELHTQLNGLDARLSTQFTTRQNELNTRLDRMDDRFDSIETSHSVMKDFLLVRMQAMDRKLELASVISKPHQDKPQVYDGCEDVLARGLNTSGVYTIALNGSKSMEVYCEQRLDGGGWTVFQARSDGTVNFTRDWNTYKLGFGNLSNEFWLGNDNIHILTELHSMQLKVELTSHEGEVKYADYRYFWVGGEAEKYILNVCRNFKTIPPGEGLGFSNPNGMTFSTFDQDNDMVDSESCGVTSKSGWWCNHVSTDYVNLNGPYNGTGYSGMWWYRWKVYESLKGTRAKRYTPELLGRIVGLYARATYT